MFPIKRMMLLAFAICLFDFSIPCFAQSATISRYLTVPLRIQKSQQQLLQQTMQIHFPSQVLNLRQAIVFSLQFTGYRLAGQKHLSQSAIAMLALPLPVINRSIGPLSLENILLTLVGPEYSLVTDPVHRLISFRLRHSFSHNHKG